jgi:hypothetical protein
MRLLVRLLWSGLLVQLKKGLNKINYIIDILHSMVRDPVGDLVGIQVLMVPMVRKNDHSIVIDMSDDSSYRLVNLPFSIIKVLFL